MSCQNNRKRNRDTMENDEVKEEYVGIIRADSIGEPLMEYVGTISADSIGEPLTSFTLCQFHKDLREMRQNQNISNILDNKEILVHKKPRYEIYENSMMTLD